jgi:uncharacterized protein (DUF1499 family)
VLSVAVLLGREQMLAIVFGPVDLSPIDFRTLTRPNRPNQFLVCPRDLCRATPDLFSPTYDIPVASLRDRWLKLIVQQPRVQQLAVSKEGWQYDFLQRSLVLRFPDTITVRFITLGDKRSTLAIYSRSHYGYSDFGVNRARVESWLTALRQ